MERDRAITLVSSSGYRVDVCYSIVKESPILREMVDNRSFVESSTSTIQLPISTPSIKRVVEYLLYKKEYLSKRGEVTDFTITDEETLDLLEVASFLKI